LQTLFSESTRTPALGGWGNLILTFRISGGISILSILSSILMRLCTWGALEAWARNRLMNSSASAISFCWRLYAARSFSSSCSRARRKSS
jgi:hypothetical protein